MEDAYQVGAALAYLVSRMPGFCGTSGSDVFMHPDRDRRDIPHRMPAVDVIKAQARNYNVHRSLYPGHLRTLLDRRVTIDTEDLEVLREGFLDHLREKSTPPLADAASPGITNSGGNGSAGHARSQGRPN